MFQEDENGSWVGRINDRRKMVSTLRIKSSRNETSVMCSKGFMGSYAGLLLVKRSGGRRRGRWAHRRHLAVRSLYQAVQSQDRLANDVVALKIPHTCCQKFSQL